jgi:hypothetical protein
MITTTNLGRISNQTWHTSINGHVYYFELRMIRGCLYASINIDETVQINNIRCVKNGWLIPCKYQTPDGGNFRFECLDQQYPNSDNFGISCNIMHYEKEDIEAL